MIEYERLLEMIRRHEGLRLKPYQCSADKTTIGYGRNLTTNGISRDEAELLLQNDLNQAIALANSLDYFHLLSDARKCVVIDMVFNLGLVGVSKFKRMAAAIIAGDYDEASRQMLDSRWSAQVGVRAMTLAGIMRTGAW